MHVGRQLANSTYVYNFERLLDLRTYPAHWADNTFVVPLHVDMGLKWYLRRISFGPAAGRMSNQSEQMCQEGPGGSRRRVHTKTRGKETPPPQTHVVRSWGVPYKVLRILLPKIALPRPGADNTFVVPLHVGMGLKWYLRRISFGPAAGRMSNQSEQMCEEGPGAVAEECTRKQEERRPPQTHVVRSWGVPYKVLRILLPKIALPRPGGQRKPGAGRERPARLLPEQDEQPRILCVAPRYRPDHLHDSAIPNGLPRKP